MGSEFPRPDRHLGSSAWPFIVLVSAGAPASWEHWTPQCRVKAISLYDEIIQTRKGHKSAKLAVSENCKIEEFPSKSNSSLALTLESFASLRLWQLKEHCFLSPMISNSEVSHKQWSSIQWSMGTTTWYSVPSTTCLYSTDTRIERAIILVTSFTYYVNSTVIAQHSTRSLYRENKKKCPVYSCMFECELHLMKTTNQVTKKPSRDPD